MIAAGPAAVGKWVPLIRTEPEWSAYQKTIFRHVYRMKPGDSLIVEAVAGSGKTTTAIEAMRYTQGPALMLAFATSNVADLQERAPEGVEVRSAHSLCLKILRDSLGAVEVDRGRWTKFAKTQRLERCGLKTRDCLRALSLAKNLGIGPDAPDAELLPLALPATFTNLVRSRELAVEQVMRFLRAGLKAALDDPRNIDFDDMIWLPYIMELKPKFRFAWIMLDEAQDLNVPQMYAALSSVKASGGVLAFGDPAQALYAFRGADSNAMGKLGATLNADWLPLSVSYRCSQAVADIARAFVPQFEARPGADTGQVRAIDGLDEALDMLHPGDAVLSRVNAPLLDIAIRLVKRGVPARIMKSNFVQRLEHLLNNVGSIEQLLKSAEAMVEQVEALRDTLGENDACLLEARDIHAGLVRLAAEVYSVDEIKAYIKDLYGDAASSAAVNLSTIHRAKGLEFDRVAVLNWTFYEPEDTLDGRNLRYVAATRARHELYYVASPNAPS